MNEEDLWGRPLGGHWRGTIRQRSPSPARERGQGGEGYTWAESLSFARLKV